MSFLTRIVEPAMLHGFKVVFAGWMPMAIQHQAFAAIERWTVGDPKTVRYRLAAGIQPHLSEISGYPLCSYCHWVEWPGEPHKHCREVVEHQRQAREEIDAAWREHERKRQAELDAQPCSHCGHPLGEHAGPDCMIPNCFCSGEYFDERRAEEQFGPNQRGYLAQLETVEFVEVHCGTCGFQAKVEEPLLEGIRTSHSTWCTGTLST